MIKKIIYTLIIGVIFYLYAINFSQPDNIKENPVLTSIYISFMVLVLLNSEKIEKNRKVENLILHYIAPLSFSVYAFCVEIQKESLSFSLFAFAISFIMFFVLIRIWTRFVDMFIKKKDDQ